MLVTEGKLTLAVTEVELERGETLGLLATIGPPARTCTLTPVTAGVSGCGTQLTGKLAPPVNAATLAGSIEAFVALESTFQCT